MRTCKSCKTKFEPKYNSIQPCCSPGCALKLVKLKQDKEYKAKTRELRVNLRSSDRKWHIKKAQEVFNKFIRLRDQKEPCISCGKIDDGSVIYGGNWDCGHYRSIGACPELRYEPLNAQKQCVKCNREKSGNIVEYRINLIDRIGDINLAWLEGSHDARHYSIPVLQDMVKEYRIKIKHLVEINCMDH